MVTMSDADEKWASRRSMIAHAGGQVMVVLQKVIDNHAIGDKVYATHEVSTGMNEYVRVIIGAPHANRSKADVIMSHLWDVQLLLDLRAGWRDHVTKKMLEMLDEMAAEREK